MNRYIKERPAKPTFTQQGVTGFQFRLANKQLEIYYEDSKSGHDYFVKAKDFTHLYYILKGEGFFTINNEKFDVCEGIVIEIPPQTEFAFTGKMKLILIVDRPFDPEKLEIIKRNLS